MGTSSTTVTLSISFHLWIIQKPLDNIQMRILLLRSMKPIYFSVHCSHSKFKSRLGQQKDERRIRYAKPYQSCIISNSNFIESIYWWNPQVVQMAADVMAKLPEVIDEVEVRRVMGDSLQQPLNIVLLQEVMHWFWVILNITFEFTINFSWIK